MSFTGHRFPTAGRVWFISVCRWKKTFAMGLPWTRWKTSRGEICWFHHDYKGPKCIWVLRDVKRFSEVQDSGIWIDADMAEVVQIEFKNQTPLETCKNLNRFNSRIVRLFWGCLKDFVIQNHQTNFLHVGFQQIFVAVPAKIPCRVGKLCGSLNSMCHHRSGPIIAITRRQRKWQLSMEIPLFQGNSGWCIIIVGTDRWIVIFLPSEKNHAL